MKTKRKLIRRALLVSMFLLLCRCVYGQTADSPQASPTPAPAASQDKSGTNPLVLRTTVQIFNEYYNLPGEGLYNNRTTFRFVVPFAKKRASIKVDLPFNATNTSIGFLTGGLEGPIGPRPIGVVPGDTKFGFGDLNLKLTYVPYFNTKLKLGLVTSVEFGFNTASKPVLGSGKNTIAPTLVVVMFPAKNTIFAPTYKQTNSYSGDANRGNINQGAFDFYFVRMFAKGRRFINLDPQLILNYETGKVSSAVETTFGFVLSQKKGITYYATPGFPIGGNRPYDFTFKTGIKRIW
jgi:hypothetical protein